jgi:hypothetical protein
MFGNMGSDRKPAKNKDEKRDRQRGDNRPIYVFVI